MTTSCCKTSQKCKLYQQCFSRKIGENYARNDKLCHKIMLAQSIKAW